jgi:hypothetical protein
MNLTDEERQAYEEIIEEIGIKDSDFEVVDPAEEVDTELEDPIHEIQIKADNSYKGLKIRYGKITITPEGDEDGSATMSFDYEVTNVDDDEKSKLEKDEEFTNFAGRLLHYIVVQSFRTGEYRIGGNDSDNPNDDSA